MAGNQCAVAELHRRFRYDPVSGKLYWRISPPGSHVMVGDEAGCWDNGYRRVRIARQQFLVHRVIWAMAYGWWPDEVDHQDLDRSNNRLDNLREATRTQNAQNMPRPSSNTSGYKGVHWRADRHHWRVLIRCDGKSVYLGSFATAEDGHAAYRAAAKRFHGEFARAE